MLEKTGLLSSKRLEILDSGLNIEVNWKWFTPIVLIVTAIAIGLAFDCFVNFDDMLARANRRIWVSVEIVAGIGFAYSALAGLFNRTSITAGAGKLVIRHGPIPWVGNAELAIAEIKQLYSKRKSQTRGGGGPVSFEVRAVIRSGKDIRLVWGLDSQEQAFSIEQAIEQQLGIKDAYVAGGIWNDATHYPSQLKSPANRSDA